LLKKQYLQYKGQPVEAFYSEIYKKHNKKCTVLLSSVAHDIITVLLKVNILKLILMHVPCIFITVFITTSKCTINITTLTFRGPCVVMCSYNKNQKYALFLIFIW